jgi:hypothetical protein
VVTAAPLSEVLRFFATCVTRISAWRTSLAATTDDPSDVSVEHVLGFGLCALSSGSELDSDESELTLFVALVFLGRSFSFFVGFASPSESELLLESELLEDDLASELSESELSESELSESDFFSSLVDFLSGFSQASLTFSPAENSNEQ